MTYPLKDYPSREAQWVAAFPKRAKTIRAVLSAREEKCECLDGGHNDGTGVCLCGGRISAREDS